MMGDLASCDANERTTMNLEYHLVDVFTDQAFGGNPLAVCPDGRNLPGKRMQKIAQEFNLSETTFVLPPKDPKHDFHVRIFTPTAELPTAGHPTVGTAFVLARLGKITKSAAVFEEGVGPIPVALEGEKGKPGMITMDQPLPQFGPRLDDVRPMAEALSLKPSEVSDLPIEVVSCGVPFLFIPIKNLDAIGRVALRVDLWQKHFARAFPSMLFLFTMQTQHPGSTVHSRMLAPALGIAEDPATGIASGPLGCYLLKHGLVSDEQATHLVSEQGIEMGRPSFIHIHIERQNGKIARVRVGGTCVYMGQGRLEVPKEAP